MIEHHPIQFDRAIGIPSGADGTWWMHTDGHCAILLRDKPDDMVVSATTGATLDGVDEFRAARLVGADRESLQAFVEPPPCDACHERRARTCPSCHGETEVVHTCENCPHRHRCVCPVCVKGKVWCDCAKPRLVLVRGGCIDAWRVDRILQQMPAGLLRLGVTKHALVLRVHAVLGLVMLRSVDSDTPPPFWVEPSARAS